MHADQSVIAWGHGAQSGELGFGAGGQKSSARPKKVWRAAGSLASPCSAADCGTLTWCTSLTQVDALEGVSVAQVACGTAFTALLVERSQTIDELPEFTPVEVAGVAEEDSKSKGKAKASSARPVCPRSAPVIGSHTLVPCTLCRRRAPLRAGSGRQSRLALLEKKGRSEREERSVRCSCVHRKKAAW